MADPTSTAQGLVTVELEGDGVKRWKTRVDAALKVMQRYETWWQAAIDNYSPKVSENPNKYQLQVRTNRAFTIVERKKADLFFKKPDVVVAPSPLMEVGPNHAMMASAHATIINHKLGLDGVNAVALARDCIFASELFGAGWSKMFYRAYTTDVTRPVMDPMTGQPTMDEMGQPVTETVPVPIFSECGWEPFGNRQALIPADFRSTDFDKAPWLGMRFTMALSEARSIWKDAIPEDFKSSGTISSGSTDNRQFFTHGGQDDIPSDANKDLVTGVEIYYKSMLERPTIPHPLHLTKLVLIDGIPEPVEHRDSPDQSFDAQGQLTPDSLIGYPFHPLTIRTLTDSAYLMSDVMIALPQTQELDKYRVQGVMQRDINLTKFVYNTATLPQAEMEKIRSSDHGGIIGLPPEAFNSPSGPITALQNTPIPADNFQMTSQIDADLAQTFAIDATASGTYQSGSQTATESNLRQANVNVRLGAEQGFVADWFVKGVTKFSTLVQRYLSPEEAAKIVGPQQAQAWDSWRKKIPTALAFTMTPDSSLRNDTPLDRLQLQQLFTYLANDPHVNRPYFLEKLLEKFHLDPTRALIPDSQLPQPKKEEPKMTLAFRGEDLSPLSPQSPIVLDLLMKAGMQIDPNALVMANQLGVDAAKAMIVQKAAETNGTPKPPDTTHGGKLAPIEGLDKHLADLTGGQDGSGAMMPGMSAGNASVQ